jgi:hypothetical protein
LGRPKVPKLPNEVSQKAVAQEFQGDSVSEDIRKFKSTSSTFLSRITKVLSPFVARGAATVQLATAGTGQFLKRGVLAKLPLKKILRFGLIAFFVATLVLIAIRVFKTIREEKDGNGGVEATPSPAVYQPYKPSLWADDPEVLRLEEDISVIDRELTETYLREDKLLPPGLDFDIRF